MNTEQIIWKEPFTGTGTVTNIGTVNELFANDQFLPVTKNLDRRVTLMFKNAEGKVANVLCSDVVTKLYRAGKITINHILGFPVIVGQVDEKIDGKLTGKKVPAMFASLPATGWAEVKSVKVVAYVQTPVDYNDPALSNV